MGQKFTSMSLLRKLKFFKQGRLPDMIRSIGGNDMDYNQGKNQDYMANHKISYH